MSRLRGKKVLLGVTGGIAAYKAPELVRALRRAGAEVRVLLSAGAPEFVSASVLEVVSGNRVGQAVFDRSFEHEIGHIELARWADVFVVAPATAHTIAKLRVGLADDLLTTIALATTAPLVVFPAMNTQMLGHPATGENLAVLRARPRVTVVDPDAGDLACGEAGAGRLPDPPVILAAAERALPDGALAGAHVLVTAGPTQERVDPVRFLSNPSSGKMGFALAEAAWASGARVTLIAGPVALPTPFGVTRIDSPSAAEMATAVYGVVDGDPVDVLFMTAAVADWTPTHAEPQKVKKGSSSWTPELRPTDDILAAIAGRSTRPRVTIGFAAETEDVEAYAREKLARKRLDAIVANSVAAGGAFGNDRNTVTYIPRVGPALVIGPAPKRDVADALVAHAAAAVRTTAP